MVASFCAQLVVPSILAAVLLCLAPLLQAQNIVFTIEPKDAIVSPNAPLLLGCTARTTLTGSLLILWKRNNVWIHDYDSKHYKQVKNGSLYFQTFLSADQGQYQCSAVVQGRQGNTLGQIYSKIVKAEHAYLKSQFTLAPEQKSAQLGANVQLQCISPESSPLAKIDWERNGVALYGYRNGSSQIGTQKLTTSTIEIFNLSLVDVGNYQCVASNPLLPETVVRSTSARVNIEAKQSAPYFVKRPTALVATRFHHVAWPCFILGNPVPVIQWYKNGQLLYNTSTRFVVGSGSLVFTAVQESDTGAYSCQGTNSIGAIALGTTVPLVVAFIDYKFKEDPQNITAQVSSTVILQCRPPRSYPSQVAIHWYFQYTVVQPGGRISTHSDGKLTISDIKTSDAGVYFCVAENSHTKERRSSKKAHLSVQVTPSIQLIRNITALVGNNVTLSCTATGAPPPVIKWYKGMKEISRNGTFLISNANASDAGMYTCIAQNPAGRDTRIVLLKVFSPPRLVRGPQNTTKVLHQNVSLSCDFDSIPKSTITWAFLSTQNHKTELIVGSNSIIPAPGRLWITRIQKDNEGFYICLANNTVGQAEGRAYLKVLVPPTLINSLKNITSNVSSQAAFFCEISGDPKPAIEWYKGSVRLRSSHRISISSKALLIRNVQSSDTGWYECQGISSLGVVKSRSYLIIQVRPDPPLIRDKANISSTTIHIFWVSGFDGYSSILKYTLELKKKVGTTKWQMYDSNISAKKRKYDIVGLVPFTIYAIRMTAVNAIGPSQLSSAKEFMTLATAPSIPLGVSVTILNATSVILNWNEPDKRHGNVILYQITYGMVDHSIVNIVNISSQNGSSYAKILVSLLPFTKYYFKVRAATSAAGNILFGNMSQTAYLTMPETAPSVAPLIVNTTSILSTKISVEFTAIPPSKANGKLLGYRIYYSMQGDSGKTVITTSATKYVIGNLQKFSTYNLYVRGYTKAGEGPASLTVQVKTLQDVPGKISNFQVSVSGNSSIFISWSPPAKTNGYLTGFLIQYKSRKGQVSGIIKVSQNFTEYYFRNLTMGLTYDFQVAAQTVKGTGPYSDKIMVIFGDLNPTTPIRPSAPSTIQTPTTSTIASISPPIKNTRTSYLFNEQNLPILIGVGSVLFILIIAVIILAAIVCRRQKREKQDDHKSHWINTRSFHGGDNPAYRFDQYDFELNRAHFSEISTLEGDPTSPSTFDPEPQKVPLPDDFIWENENVERYISVHGNTTTSEDQSVTMEENTGDTLPLVKLKSKSIDLGEDASVYDRPYSSVNELGEPFSKDLLGFINSEDLNDSQSQRIDGDTRSTSGISVSVPDGYYNTDSDRLDGSISQQDFVYLVDEEPNYRNATDMESGQEAKVIPKIELPRDDKDHITMVKPKISVESEPPNYDYEKGTIVVNEDAVFVFDEHTKL